MTVINGANGRDAKVNVDGRLLTTCVTSSNEHHVNHHEGNAFNVIFSQSPTAADDCFFYMANGEGDDITIEGFTLGFKNATAVDAEIYIKLGDAGTRNSGTALTPVNLNAGSGNTVGDSTFEKGADLDGGAATLTGGSEVDRYLFANIQDRSSAEINFPQDIIIPKNKTMTMWATDAGATYYVTLHFNVHHVEIG